jgi:uncharacterized membrane protein YadS
MATLSFRLGIILAVLGVVFYTITGFEHWTSLFPTLFGIPIALCGKLTLQKPEKAVIFMHIAVVFAAILFLGSAGRLPSVDAFGIKGVALWVTTIITFVLMGAFVQSFIKARQAKKG